MLKLSRAECVVLLDPGLPGGRSMRMELAQRRGAGIRMEDGEPIATDAASQAILDQSDADLFETIGVPNVEAFRALKHHDRIAPLARATR